MLHIIASYLTSRAMVLLGNEKRMQLFGNRKSLNAMLLLANQANLLIRPILNGTSVRDYDLAKCGLCAMRVFVQTLCKRGSINLMCIYDKCFCYVAVSFRFISRVIFNILLSLTRHGGAWTGMNDTNYHSSVSVLAARRHLLTGTIIFSSWQGSNPWFYCTIFMMILLSGNFVHVIFCDCRWSSTVFHFSAATTIHLRNGCILLFVCSWFGTNKREINIRDMNNKNHPRPAPTCAHTHTHFQFIKVQLWNILQMLGTRSVCSIYSAWIMNRLISFE